MRRQSRDRLSGESMLPSTSLNTKVGCPPCPSCSLSSRCFRRWSRRTATVSGAKPMLRRPVRVFGDFNLSPAFVSSTDLSTRATPRSRSRSAHRMPQISPRRIPLPTARTAIGCSEMPEIESDFVVRAALSDRSSAPLMTRTACASRGSCRSCDAAGAARGRSQRRASRLHSLKQIEPVAPSTSGGPLVSNSNLMDVRCLTQPRSRYKTLLPSRVEVTTSFRYGGTSMASAAAARNAAATPASTLTPWRPTACVAPRRTWLPCAHGFASTPSSITGSAQTPCRRST